MSNAAPAHFAKGGENEKGSCCGKRDSDILKVFKTLATCVIFFWSMMLQSYVQMVAVTAAVTAPLMPILPQVQIQAGGSTPKVVPLKPKFYLTSSVRLAPSTFVKL